MPPRAPTFLASTLRVFDLSLGQMLWSRRSVFLAILTAGPVALAIGIRLMQAAFPQMQMAINGAQVGGASLFGMMIWGMYVRFVIPVLGVFYGTSLIADEVDDKTITYLFTRPIRRSSVLAGKFLAYLFCTILMVLPSVVIVYFIIVPIGNGSIGAAFPYLLADLGILALGLAAYGALFSLVGARMRRPLVIGLVFVFGWEPSVMLFPGYLKRATVGFYLQGLVPHSMPADSTLTALLQLFQEVPTLPSALAALVAIVIGSVWWAGRAVETREYVLEQ